MPHTLKNIHKYADAQAYVYKNRVFEKPYTLYKIPPPPRFEGLVILIDCCVIRRLQVSFYVCDGCFGLILVQLILDIMGDAVK